MMNKITYSPIYSSSHALVIGINDYQNAPPLGYAINDAKAIAKILTDKYGFPTENIQLLLDKQATRHSIMDAYLSYASEKINFDDRLVFFFAGHGHTITGRRGQVGYLVPQDGNESILSTLIRWDEFTRNTEIIPAKHILFVMDACYGGLATTRGLPPGSMRFLEDMLLRYSRQVLTAGKADEVVSDSGGPIPGHSIFTGHFLEALEGKACSEDSIITANGVMSYVYERVSKDHNSKQTPHYGFLDGDGDLIFKAPLLEKPKVEDKTKDEDILVSVPSTISYTKTEEPRDIVEQTKEYLSDPKYKIKLHDFVAQELREVLHLTSDDSFAVQGTDWSLDEFSRRMREYETITQNILAISCCISYWGDQIHHAIQRMILTRLTDRLLTQSGLVVWLSLRWYPVILLLYASGIAALASENYDALAVTLLSKVGSSRTIDSATQITLAAGEAILGLEREKVFNQLPGHESHYVARSEYLYKLLQPSLDDLLFLGRDYEEFFDKFEVIFALVHADLEQMYRSHIWGPFGRFVWKHKSYGTNPFVDVITEASKQKESWGPLRAGLFNGEYSRFEYISNEYAKLVSRQNWL